MASKSKAGPPAPYVQDDFDAIEAAVMETARGRWFLGEYAKRNRTADTQMLLTAIRKLERAVDQRTETVAAEPANGGESLDALRTEIMGLATRIAQTRHEIAELRASDGSTGGITGTTGELEAIVKTTEKATSDILGAAEQVQEIAWTLREEGVREDACEQLDAYSTEIYSACSFQDLTGQRTRKVIDVLLEMEARLNELVDGWALPGLEVRETKPPKHDAGLDEELFARPTQDDINRLFDADVMDSDADVTFRDAARAGKSSTFGKRAAAPGAPEPAPAIEEDGDAPEDAAIAEDSAPVSAGTDAFARASMELRPGSDTMDDLAGTRPHDALDDAATARTPGKSGLMSLSPAHRVALFS